MVSYWNELACKCFTNLMCKIQCGNENHLNPVDGCSCISTEELQALYPKGATERDIEYAKKLGELEMNSRMNFKVL